MTPSRWRIVCVRVRFLFNLVSYCVVRVYIERDKRVLIEGAMVRVRVVEE